MKSIVVFVLALVTFHSFSFAESKTNGALFDLTQYRDECGGYPYPDCDEEDKNQLTIFKEAEALAQDAQKTMILILGANWCPPCKTLAKTLENNSEALAPLAEKYLIVELSGDHNVTKSSTPLLQYLGVKIAGFPTVYRKKPGDAQFNPLRLPSFSKIDQFIEAVTLEFGPTYLAQEAKGIEKVGVAPLWALDVPVDLAEAYGQYPYFKTGGTMVYRTESETDKWINNGIARIHTFHYIDAVRCFRAATNLQPNNGLAKAFLALSYVLLNGGDSGKILANLELSGIDSSKLSGTSLAWVNFIKAYVYTKHANLTGENFELSIDNAHAELLKETNRDSEALTLAQYLANGSGNPQPFHEVLKKQPNHVGAHHYLVHAYEADKAYPFARDHAEKMAELASSSSHAQHMYGHILPRFKEWDAAFIQFTWAAQLHTEWAQKYGFPESFDWHYSHNLDLMGATYIGLGLQEKASEAFKVSCEHDWRACMAYLKMASIEGKSHYVDHVYRQERGDAEESDQWKEYLEPYRIEARLAVLLRTDIPRLEAYVVKESRYYREVDEVIQKLIAVKLNGSGPDAELMKEAREAVTFYAQDRLGCASFDGWGKGMLDFMRIWKVAKTLGYHSLAASLARILRNELGVDVTKQIKM
ncbi:MAG: thioredoxin family protein [Pseudomonadota bacterium]